MSEEGVRERSLNRDSDRRLVDSAGKQGRLVAEEPLTATELLYSKEFFTLLLKDIHRTGLVREDRNALATWIVGTSRLRPQPLNEIAKGRSASGKNCLVRSVLKFFSADSIVEASSLSKQAIPYMGRDSLAHKILYVSELSSARTNHPARQLISEGHVIRRVPVREAGGWVTKEVITEGPVACITTTTSTALAIDDESRNVSVWIDESYAQTREIAKSYVVRDGKTLSPHRLSVWHDVQRLIAKNSAIHIATPKFFETIAQHILPYGDLRIRRYWPAFVEACKVVCLVQSGLRVDNDEEFKAGLTVSFEQFAITAHIFDRVIAQSLSRSGTDEDLATAEIVAEMMLESCSEGVSAGDLVGKPGIQSLDKAYRLLNRAAQAGSIIRTNPTRKNNEKLYMKAPDSTFLGDPDVLANKLNLKIGGSYLHPVTGRLQYYGKKEYEEDQDAQEEPEEQEDQEEREDSE